jgi:EAL domain-containing protein (putative c-di-GMP-specific phosphodiesterase class I)
VVGVEALLRWEHPSRGLLAASEFIALAEDTGLIDDIGDWVLGEACRQLSRWEDALGDRAPTMAVNLSPRELIGGDVPGRLATTLGETGSNPARLCIELTERGVMEDADQAAATLAGLKRLGVRLAIDDFGTGHAALGYLDRFPIDLLKIDRSFVENLGPEWRSKRLVAAAISLAATLGLETVAEGVEREEQATELVGLGCNLGQGFRFAPALPPAELEKLVSG